MQAPPPTDDPTHPLAFGTRSRWAGAAAITLLLALEQLPRIRLDPGTTRLPVFVGFVVACLGLALGTFGTLESLRARLVRLAPNEPLRLALAGLEGLALGIVAFVLEPFRVLDEGARAELAALACGVAAVLYRALVRRAPRVSALLSLGVLVAVSVMRAKLTNVHYVSVHCALTLVQLCSTASFVSLLRPSIPVPPRVTASLVALGFVVAHLVLVSSSAMRSAFYMDATLGRALVRPIGTLLDLDRDGGHPGFGAVDCAPFSRDAGPFAHDVPGDGRDQDCEGGDAARATRATLGRTPAPTLPDIFLISADGLRWDTGSRLTRTAAALGPRTSFTLALAPSPRTMNSFASVLRGRAMDELPMGHASLRASLLPNRLPTIGDTLRRHGYRAVYVPPHAYLAPGTGIVTGFEEAPMPQQARVYAHATRGGESATSGDDALVALLELARTTDAPLLAMAHLMETHTPYRGARDEVFGTDHAAYLRSVDATDARLATLVETLRRVRPRPIWFVVYGDHGEAFREHANVNHSTSVNAEQVRVVFWIAGPDLPVGRVDAPVSTSALPATLLDLLGLPPEPSFTVPSLGPCMAERRACPTVARSDLHVVQRASDLAVRGFTTTTHRVIVDRAHDSARIYDLVRDPYEQIPLTTTGTAAHALLRRLTTGSAGSP